MNNKITAIIECLSSAIENDEVISVEKLSAAIDDLENFPMSLTILDSCRVGQILQSIRHSKIITVFLNERIRSLIKCWRQLLNDEIFSIIPNQVKTKLSKTPVLKNGYCNGYIPNSLISNNSLPIIEPNHSNEKCLDVNLKDKEKPPDQVENEIVGNIVDEELLENRSSKTESPKRIRNISNLSKLSESLPSQNETQHIPMSQNGKPKLKSTKELLADFSNFIENDTKNKILMNKINQEDDDPVSYFPQDFKVKELIQLSILQKERESRKRVRAPRIIISDSEDEYEPEEKISRVSKCENLLKQFQEMCTQQPKVVLRHFVPWNNLKHGINLHPPEIKLPLSQRKLLQNSKNINNPKASECTTNTISLNEIDNLLESFEVRDKQIQMISDAIQQRKEQTKVIDNTVSIVDVAMKLKLKIPKVPILKLRRRKKKKKKKPKPKPVKIRIKKPRKPYIRPMPPITNYLNDIPSLPPLPQEFDSILTPEAYDKETVEFSEENVTKLAYGVFEGYNCTKHTQTSKLIPLTSMYSNVIGERYLHIFPWIDLQYSTRSTFPVQSYELFQSLIEIPDFFS